MEPEVPKEIELTELELLKLENGQLKLNSAMQRVAGLRKEQQALIMSIEERLGIKSLMAYSLDPESRKGVLHEED